jgi:hypothetical protein
MTQRVVRYTIAIPVGLGLAFADQTANPKRVIYIQTIIWTAFVLLEFPNELRKYAKRKRLRLLFLLGVVPIHAAIVSACRRSLPFEQSLIVLVYGLIEFVVLAIAFLRLGQELDPEGPLGLTEADRKRIRPRLFM